VTSVNYSADQTLPANRARQITISNSNAGGITVTLPTQAEGTLVGDTYVIVGGSTMSGPITVRGVANLSPLVYNTLVTITATGQQYRLRSGGGSSGNWSLIPVDTHTHAAADVTTGTFDNARVNFAAPPAIGNTTPAAGTFTTLTANNDTEVTDSTKGLVLKSPNNTRWRITINDDGTLSRVALAIMTLLAFAASGMAQVRDMVTDTNGNIVTGRTNELTFTNNLRFAPLTNANSRTALISTNGALTAGNPPSGAAANGALLAADGAGSSSFVASRTVTKFTTNDQTKTNWGFNAVTQSTNNDPQMGSWALDANSFYRIEYAVAWVATTNSGFAHGLGFTTNLSEFNHRSGVGQAANATVTAITSGTNATAIGLANVSAASSGSRFAVAGFVYVLTSSNANTMNYRWYPINNSADATTLIQSSMLSVTKMAP
jgi:hypothetical protein